MRSTMSSSGASQRLKNITRKEQTDTDHQLPHSKLVIRSLSKPNSSKPPDLQRNCLRRTWDHTRSSAPPDPTPLPYSFPPNSAQFILCFTYLSLNQQYRIHFPAALNPHL